MWPRTWRRLRGHVSNVPGVVYSDCIDVAAEEQRLQLHPEWRGMLRNMLPDTEPPLLKLQTTAQVPGPEEVPYTKAELLGMANMPLSRVRPRQYYHPITDFALYDYDEAAPEERELRARWFARVTQYKYTGPVAAFVVAMLAAPVMGRLRHVFTTVAVIGSTTAEAIRAYMAAAEQRQDYDDFLLAKELWYIKNVETYQLDIPRIPGSRTSAPVATS